MMRSTSEAKKDAEVSNKAKETSSLGKDSSDSELNLKTKDTIDEVAFNLLITVSKEKKNAIKNSWETLPLAALSTMRISGTCHTRTSVEEEESWVEKSAFAEPSF